MSDPTALIVLVEDDPGHALLIERNLRRAGLENEIVRLEDGRQALDFLQADAAVALERSVLTLLDLNLPDIDGATVLERLKSDVRTRANPVVILTTSDHPREVRRCYEMGCSLFVVKPVDAEAFTRTLHRLGLLLSTAELPVPEDA